jgi:hypothetical protein
MRAGPSLDAEIARLIFGWLLIYDSDAGIYWKISNDSRTSIPQYSENSSVSSTIVDHFRNDGWAFRYHNDAGGFLAGFSRDDGSTYRSFRAETLALATCAAALAVANETHIQSK